jgi:Predicted oxidoreductases (related to aryl-alcohol dehydrogenases)
MKKRQLGSTDIKISEVGLGTWQMSGDVWGKKTEAEYCRGMEVAIEAGIDYFDTALEYGNGYCEQVVGRYYGDFLLWLFLVKYLLNVMNGPQNLKVILMIIFPCLDK